MKKLFKKSIACLIAVLMVVSSMPFTAITANAALAYMVTGQYDFTSTISDSTFSNAVEGYSGSSYILKGNAWDRDHLLASDSTTFDLKTIYNRYPCVTKATAGQAMTFRYDNGNVEVAAGNVGLTGLYMYDGFIYIDNIGSYLGSEGFRISWTEQYFSKSSDSGAGVFSLGTGNNGDVLKWTTNDNKLYAGGSEALSVTPVDGTVYDITLTSGSDKKISVLVKNHSTNDTVINYTTSGTFEPTSLNYLVIGSVNQSLDKLGRFTLSNLTIEKAYDSSDPTDVPASANAQTAYNNINNANRTYNNVSFTGADTNYLNGVITGTSFGGSTTATVDRFSDSTSTKHESKVHGLTNGVAIYTGPGCDIRFPVVYEHLKGGNKTGVTHYVGIDHLYFSSGNFQLGQDTWKRCSGWNNLTDNSDNSHDFSALSTGKVDRAENSATGRFEGTNQKYWKNCIKYTGSVNTDTYYEKLTSANFNYQADYTWSWLGGRKWASKSNYTRTFSSNFGLYVINYAPLKEIIESKDFKTNFETIYNNRWMYDDEAREKYFDVMAKITTFNLSEKTMTNESQVSNVAAEIKGMVDDYNKYNSPAKKKITVTFRNSTDTATISTKTFEAGNAIGAFPANTETSPDEHGYGDIYHNKYTWDTALTPESVPTSNITIYEKATPEAHSSTTPATCITKQICDACGATFGDFGSHNLTKTAAKDATCTEAGNSAYWTCSTCDKIFSDANAATEIPEIPTISAKGHTWGDWVYDADKQEKRFCTVCDTVDSVKRACVYTVKSETPATCIATGKRVYRCTQCGNEYDEILPINPEAHNTATRVETTNATCTVAGKKETVTYCTLCNTEISREKTEDIPAPGHDYEVKYNDETNVDVFTCKNCNDTYSKTVAKMEELNAAIDELEALVNADDATYKYEASALVAAKEAVANAKAYAENKENRYKEQGLVDAETDKVLSAETELTENGLAEYTVTFELYNYDGGSPIGNSVSVTKKYGEIAEKSYTFGKTEEGFPEYVVSKWTKKVLNDKGEQVETVLNSTANDMSVVVKENATYTCYVLKFKASTEGENATTRVRYLDKSGKTLKIEYVNVGTTYTPEYSKVPKIPYYRFSEWKRVYGEDTPVGTRELVYQAQYEYAEVEANKCIIVGLPGVYVNGTTGTPGYTAYYDEKIQLTGADKFAYANADGSIIAPINENYIFAPHLNGVDKTIYITKVETPITEAKSIITGVFTTHDDPTYNYLVVNAQYYLPEGAKAVEAGAVIGKYNNADSLKIGSAVKVVSDTQGDNHEYSLQMSYSKNKTGTLYARSYLIYVDSNGDTQTVYSDDITTCNLY